MADLVRVYWKAPPEGWANLGRLSLQPQESFNTAAPLDEHEVARLPYGTNIPDPIRYYEWNGSVIVERSQADKDAIDAAILASRAKDPVRKGIEQRLVGVIQAKFGLSPPYTPADVKTVINALLQEKADARAAAVAAKADWDAAVNQQELKVANSAFLDASIDYFTADAVFSAAFGVLFFDELISNRRLLDETLASDYDPE